MFIDWSAGLLAILKTLNQIITAGVAITAFSLLLYALPLNLRDRVVRSFALILLCLVTVFTAKAISSTTTANEEIEWWLRLQWVGLIFLPPTYLHFSDALLATTGKPSKGKRRWAIRLTYVFSTGILVLLITSSLVGPVNITNLPAPHLTRTPLTDLFTIYYGAIMVMACFNFGRAYQRTITRTNRRRMFYLLAGATAPAIGSYPYLLYSSSLFAHHPILFWLLALLSSLVVGVLLVVMAYVVAFFGVPWPDRVVKSRLFKWLMRGPVTASIVLGITTIVRRAGAIFNVTYSEFVPIAMVGFILLMEYMITLFAPLWESLLFYGNDRNDLSNLRSLEDHLLTSHDLRQFLEVVISMVCDRVQSKSAFVAALKENDLELIVTIGDGRLAKELQAPQELLESISQNGDSKDLFKWGNNYLLPLFDRSNPEEDLLLGLLGFAWDGSKSLSDEEWKDLSVLAQRASQALHDWRLQQNVLLSLKALNPQVALIQELRAAGRYDNPDAQLGKSTSPSEDIVTWVKEALTHYWGGPKLTGSPLMRLQVVKDALESHEGNDANALRSILRKAIEQVRPVGERRFTAEWILYNILEMKFMQGKKVREIALRLAMSEADLYRKQRVAIEVVAKAILEMEQETRQEASHM